LLITTPVYAVENFKISNYGGAHQIWFEVEDFDERNPKGDQYYPVVDAAGAFGGQAINPNDLSGGMIRWTFDIAKAGGQAGTWYLWPRLINPSNASDYMLVKGDPGDAHIPNGPPFPGGDNASPFTNDDDRVFEVDVDPWDWRQKFDFIESLEGLTKELQDGENTMYIFHRGGDNSVFWDVFMWTDSPDYVPTDEDYENATIAFADLASYPSPANDATDVSRDDVVLSWKPGPFAAPTNGHKVYLGENFDDVNDATSTVDPAGVYMGSQDANSLALDRLDFSKTYYWRVDEVNAPPTSQIEFKGKVWSFTIEPIAYPIENITAAASSAFLVDTGPENTVNGSGLDVNDLHSTEETAMWMSGDEPGGAWIEFEFDKVYKLHEMLVWNSNKTVEKMFGLGCKDVTIEYLADGNEYTTLGTTHEFAQAPGTSGYAHNTTIDFDGVTAKKVRLTISSNWRGFLSQYSLSEVRFTYIPVFAREPQPESVMVPYCSI